MDDNFKLDIPAEMLPEAEPEVDIKEVDETQPLAIQALVEEIKERAERSKYYIEQRDSAKTATKAKVFDKKITENNTIAAELITALQLIVEKRDAAASEESNTEE